LTFHRATWLTFFAIGAVVLAVALGAFDAWATGTAVPGAEAYCRGTLAGTIPLARAPLCFAVWFVEAKSWVFYLRDILLQARQGLYLHELVRTADVGLFAAGGAAMALALNWVWATAMTQMTLATVAGSYSLVHGLSHVLGRRAA
jgi:hypothetical protein